MHHTPFPTIQQTIRKLKDDNTFEKQYDSLLHYDIIQEDDQDREKAQLFYSNKFYLEEKEKQLILEKCMATFAGSAIGDALGNQTDQFTLDYERNIIHSFDTLNDLRCPRSLYTDDTSLALCIADSFLCNDLKFNGQDIRHRFLLWWFESYNNGKSEFFKPENQEKDEYSLKEVKLAVKTDLWDMYSFGVGITTFNSFIDFIQYPSKEKVKEYYGQMNSNGSLMRIASIPILFHEDILTAAEISKRQSLLTNDGLEAAECCQLLSMIIVALINEQNDKEEISVKDQIDKAVDKVKNIIEFESDGVKSLASSEQEKYFAKDSYNQCLEDRDWNWKKHDFKYSPTRSKMSPTGAGAYSMDALAMSLHINYYCRSFQEVVFKAANLGGDSDTVGCISGMIAGSIYGLSDDLRKLYKFIEPSDKSKTLIRAYKLFLKKSVK